MAVNRGKQFEEEIRNGFLKVRGVSIDRFPDPMVGYKGIRNICDFQVYKYPFSYYFECKSIRGNTLNFKSDITQDQWDGLLEKVQVLGIMAGVFIWYIDHDITVFVPIYQLERMRSEGKKSINRKDLDEESFPYLLVPAKRKRVLFSYSMAPFLIAISEFTKKYWKLEDK